MALPNYVEESDSGSLATSTTLSHTIPSGWSVGDLVVAVVTCISNRSVTGVPSGWTAIGAELTGLVRLNAYRKILESGDINASHTWTLDFSSSSSNQITFIRITAHDPTTPVNVLAEGVDGGNVTSHVTSSVTTTVDDCLILRIIASNSTQTASSGDTGTEEQQNYRIRIFRSSKASAGATGTATYTTVSSIDQPQKTIAIAPAGGGGPTTFPAYYYSQL